MTKIIIAIVGPTAIGKTTRAISLAKHYHTEIISADSRQFYKEMNIGTAVPSAAELGQAKHHFIQHKSIHDRYSVGDFERDAARALKDLFKKHEIIVMVGGSGLYMDAVLYGLDEFPETDATIRKDLNAILRQNGILPLQEQLKQLDPVYYDKVDIENPHRLIRALEVCISSGAPYSSFLGRKKTKHEFPHILLGLYADREVIYKRINERVDTMLRDGLLEEAKNLVPYSHLNALNTVGYKELFAHFEGKQSLEDAIEEIKKNTRRFAKRQLTWYRKNKEVLWLDFDLSEEEFITTVESHIQKFSNVDN
jgi:tRNA dimethylallyltransferase